MATAGRVRRRSALLAVTIGVALALACLWIVIRPPDDPAGSPLLVRDVTQLNSILVNEVITPTSTDEIIQAVKSHAGPISIGGARHSMGGQIATAGAFHIDMRRFDRILDFSPAKKTITVQGGVRWRQILERVDPANLSVSVMQSYANFTVGGSLSTNVHGRYAGQGPLITSVKSIKVVLADGTLVEASSTQHSDIFYGVIGGYGGLGIITEATFELTDNVKLKRQDQLLPIENYAHYFLDEVRQNADAVFHNGDIYPDAYETVHAITYSKTDAPVTVADRLIPTSQSYRLNRFVYWVVSEWPFGKAFREHVIDPVLFRGESVTSRNYQSSYDVGELEPASRANSTYALEEYFIPTAPPAHPFGSLLVPVPCPFSLVPFLRKRVLKGANGRVLPRMIHRHGFTDPKNLRASEGCFFDDDAFWQNDARVRILAADGIRDQGRLELDDVARLHPRRDSV